MLRRELGFSEEQLGLAGSVFVWVYALCMPVTGRLADIMPRDRLVISSLVLWIFATLGTGVAHSPYSFLAWRAVMGVTEALYFPAAIGIIADLQSSSTRSKALGIHQAGQLAGIVGGGLYGGWAADHVGWCYGFALMAAAGLLYAIPLKVVVGRLPRGSSRRTTENQLSPAVFVRSRCYMALSLAFFAFCAMLWIIYAWLPNFLYQKYHLSMASSGLSATLYVQVSSGVGVVVGGVFADRLVHFMRSARFYIASAGLLGSAPLAYLIFATNSLSMMKVASTAFGFFAGLTIGNIFAAIYDVVPKRLYGSASGFLNMLGGISGAAGMFAVGHWKASVTVPTVVACVAIATASIGILLAIIVGIYFTADQQRTYAIKGDRAG